MPIATSTLANPIITGSSRVIVQHPVSLAYSKLLGRRSLPNDEDTLWIATVHEMGPSAYD